MSEVAVKAGLTRVPTEQLMVQWGTLKPLIGEVLATDMEVTKALYNNIAMSLMSGNLSCWVRVEEDERISALLLTSVERDPVTRLKYFWIHALWGDSSGDREAWLDTLETLKRAARNLGCAAIACITHRMSVVKFIRAVGGQARHTVATIPLED